MAYILYRFTPSEVIIMGAYTTLVAAEASLTAKASKFVIAQNLLRDQLHAAGESCNTVLTLEDVLPHLYIKSVTIN